MGACVPDWAGSKTDFACGIRLRTVWVKWPAWGHLSTLRRAWGPQLVPSRSRPRLLPLPAPTSSSSSPESDSGSTGTSSFSPMVPMKPSSASMLRKQPLSEASAARRRDTSFPRPARRRAHVLYVTSALENFEASPAWFRIIKSNGRGVV